MKMAKDLSSKVRFSQNDLGGGDRFHADKNNN